MFFEGEAVTKTQQRRAHFMCWARWLTKNYLLRMYDSPWLVTFQSHRTSREGLLGMPVLGLDRRLNDLRSQSITSGSSIS